MVLVSGEPVVQRLVATALDSRGFQVARTGAPQLEAATLVDMQPDVVLVDSRNEAPATVTRLRGLPSAAAVPIIVTSEHGTAVGARQALDAGADDYLARPFDATELAARVRSLVRRRGRQLASGRERVGPAIVDQEARSVTLDGRLVRLSRSEWELLICLIGAGGHVVPHDELLRVAFGWEAVGDLASLRAAIGRLRRKLGATSGDAGPIRTVRGFGYAVERSGSR